jgi:hypothetical protein
MKGGEYSPRKSVMNSIVALWISIAVCKAILVGHGLELSHGKFERSPSMNNSTKQYLATKELNRVVKNVDIDSYISKPSSQLTTQSVSTYPHAGSYQAIIFSVINIFVMIINVFIVVFVLQLFIKYLINTYH